MKDAKLYLTDRGQVNDDTRPSYAGRQVIAAEHDLYTVSFEAATLTLQEARDIPTADFDDLLEARVVLNDSFCYMSTDAGALLENKLGKEIAKRFGLTADGGDKLQFLVAKLATKKQADNLIAAVRLYDKIAHSEAFKGAQDKEREERKRVRDAMTRRLTDLIVRAAG